MSGVITGAGAIAAAFAGPFWAFLVAAFILGLGTGVPGGETGGWSALEVLAHLRDVDREVYRPRVDRLLAESEPAFENLDAASWTAARGSANENRDAVLAGWREARAGLIAALAPLGPADWRRLAWHSTRGPFPLAEMVREWVEHDLSHRRQIALALGERL